MSISGWDLRDAAKEIKDGLVVVGEGLKAIASALENK